MRLFNQPFLRLKHLHKFLLTRNKMKRVFNKLPMRHKPLAFVLARPVKTTLIFKEDKLILENHEEQIYYVYLLVLPE